MSPAWQFTDAFGRSLPGAPGHSTPETREPCRNSERFFRCLGDLGFNFVIEIIPGVGFALVISGTEIHLFQERDIYLNGPSAGALSDAGAKYTQYEFKSLGGQAQLNKYNDIHKRNGLGQRPNAVRRSLQNLSIVGKTFGGIAKILGIFESVCEVGDCYKKYCK